MKHRNLLAIAALVIATLFTGQSSFAQNRNIGAQTFTMDDGAGHFFTMQAPAGLTNPNLNYQFPTPPAGNPPSGFVNIGTAGQTLFWNATAGHNAWEASSVITNNTNGNGTNVTITAPLIGAGASFTTLGASGLTTLSNTLYVRTATTAVNGDIQAVAIRATAPGPNWTGAGAFGGASATVIMGENAGVAQLGGNNSNLSAWQNLYINAGGTSVRIGSLTPPVSTLDISGSLGASSTITFSALNATGVVHNSNAGVLSTSLVSLTSDVSGIIPIANGGTGSNTQNFVDLTTAQSVGGAKTFTAATVANTFASSGATITGGSLNGTTVGATTASTGAFTTLSAGSGKLTVDVNGNVTKINNVTSSFPAAQGAAGAVLTNDGTGNLSWQTAGASSAAVVSTNSTYTGGGSLGSNQNDLAISATGTYFKINTTANVNVTGINATGSADGRVVYFSNVGVTGFSVTFNNLNGGSSANDQFTLPGGFDVTIGNNSTAVFIYDATAHKWRLVSSN